MPETSHLSKPSIEHGRRRRAGCVSQPWCRPRSARPSAVQVSKEEKLSNTTVHQITSGIVGWLTYEQMRKGTDNLTEHSLYKPIEDIAKGRRFEVRNEFPIPKTSSRGGGSKEVDFVIVNRASQSVLALEVKYKRRKKRLTGSIGSDAAKLLTLTVEGINEQILAGRGYPIRRSVTGFSGSSLFGMG